MSTPTAPQNPMKEIFPRHLSYPENAEDIAAYKKTATVEVVVMIDQIFFHEGKQWAYRGEMPKMSVADAEALDAANQVKIISA